ncbi:MAG: nickel responsive regulator [Candidatus Methanofastidiosum methylothiophilum]|uniref:Nickel responsive regulator n=1 Tax=Candidatus Methanofastidiosum methylothiophilum TaxID=1705564 RepID=A0A150IV96_9EURY|nr:MAG: nickel responsive regulator [Candidatus Methanofastidiosum methylthiophilus]OPX57168.1 MAG: nickel responsive regulator [Methanobacterium sp. PtaB.Bin024]
MTRISMNFPQELLNEFDEVLKRNGYNSEQKDSKMHKRVYKKI